MGSESTEKPLVSFCVMCYNQERYIGEALEGAFAQTYRPLEIVISDDASSDRSWEVITKAVEEYRRRPDAAEVVLNRNEKNQGDLGNWITLCSLAKGRLLVKADGDDVSLPERTERIVSAWVADGCRATLVSNSGFMIGPRGQRLGQMWQVNAAFPAGALMTFDRATFDVFGGTDFPRVMDDGPFLRRALMLGPELVLSDRLVKYRMGTGRSNSLLGVRDTLRKPCLEMLVVLKQTRKDLEKIRDRLSAEGYADWQARIENDRVRFENELKLYDGRSFATRLEGFRKTRRARLLSVWQFLKLAFLAPRPIGDCLLFLYAVVRHVVRRTKGVLGR